MRKLLFCRITHHLEPKIRRMLVKGMFGNEDSTFHFGLLINMLLK